MPQQAEWNLVLHLCADAKLAHQSAAILDSITQAAVQLASPDVNVLVERVTTDATQTTIIAGVKSEASVGAVNTGSPDSLTKLLTWASGFPAKRTALVIFGHGNGVHDWKTIAARPVALIAPTTSYADALTIPELRSGIEAAQLPKLDILAMNACLMGMIEIAYELRDVGKVMIASELDDSDHGWPYAEILQRLAAHPAIGAEELSAVILDETRKKYEQETMGRVIAALRLDALEAVAQAVATVIDGLGTAPRASIEKARSAMREAEGEPFVDVASFLVTLRDQGVEIGDALTTLGSALVPPLLKLNASDETGLSLYFPNDAEKKSTLDDYGKIAFVDDAEWGAFLATWLAGLSPPTS